MTYSVLIVKSLSTHCNHEQQSNMKITVHTSSYHGVSCSWPATMTDPLNCEQKATNKSIHLSTTVSSLGYYKRHVYVTIMFMYHHDKFEK